MSTYTVNKLTTEIVDFGEINQHYVVSEIEKGGKTIGSYQSLLEYDLSLQPEHCVKDLGDECSHLNLVEDIDDIDFLDEVDCCHRGFYWQNHVKKQVGG